ncbi:hypothetical protein ACQPWY_14840 [Pseudonocardia xinjiangensis]|uniref:hypothetical protein n=1 Tax=Pseudonocardia xinjiangensis TaxID=75289 RepID=UPI003D8B607B
MSVLAIVGIVALIASGTVALPFQRLVTLVGVGGSKIEYLDDPVVRAQLLRHHMAVRLTALGSREAARVPLDGVDFVFPSGQPAAELVAERRVAAREYSSPHRVFVSPIVLATYREYAETLRAAGVARPQANQDPEQPYYYDLDLAGFLELARAGRSWDALGIGGWGFTNGNTVLAQTTDVCAANSAATYLGLVAYVTRGGVPVSVQDAVDLALQIKPLFREQGLPTRNPDGIYFVPEGRGILPIVVIYEHQYLAYQLQRVGRGGEPDQDRVLLYPDVEFQSEPTMVALNADAQSLAVLLGTDSVLRRRALELGYRVLDSSLEDSSAELPRFLSERGVPAPAISTSYTRGLLPDVPMLEAMITTVGDCRPMP